MAEERLKQRLTAILAADVAGYSRLMSMDERATVAALDAARAVFREQIEANQGRVIDMAGDSVLAVFEIAAGAVGAALAVQKALTESAYPLPEDRRMRFRIGIHLGDVIEKADGTIYGDGVNIAARLEGLAEPGGIAVSESIRTAVKSKVDAPFDDLGVQQVKNIAEPVHAYRVATRASGQSSPKRSVGDIDLSLPDKPSIAVLPFVNMSGDPEQEYFSDGITEDIITELARFPSLFVIARNSTFTYKGHAIDVKRVSRELGVRYVVEGSVRRTANRIRVTAQLIDSSSGAHLWAEKFDRVLEDIFEVQEEVTACIVGAVAPQVDAAELLRVRQRPGNLSAYEVAMRGIALFQEAYPKSDDRLCVEALELGRKALAMDPDSEAAGLLVAFAHFQRLLYHTAEDRPRAWDEAIQAVNHVIGAHPAASMAHACKAHLLQVAPSGPRWEEARFEGEAALRLGPHDARAISMSAVILAQTGDPRRAIELLERALRLSPRDPLNYNRYLELALAHLIARDYAAGLEWALQSRSVAPDFPQAHLFIAALQVGLGQLDKARAALASAQQLAPRMVQSRLKPRVAGSALEHQHRYSVFLRIAAGLEDPSAAESVR